MRRDKTSAAIAFREVWNLYSKNIRPEMGVFQ